MLAEKKQKKILIFTFIITNFKKFTAIRFFVNLSSIKTTPHLDLTG